MLVWGAVGPAIICPARVGWGVGPGMGLGRVRVGWNHWSGVLLEDPPASGSAAVRPPIWGVESCARRRTPLGQDQASKDLSHIPRGCTQAKGIAWAQHRGPVSDDTRRAVPRKNGSGLSPLWGSRPTPPNKLYAFKALNGRHTPPGPQRAALGGGLRAPALYVLRGPRALAACSIRQRCGGRH